MIGATCEPCWSMIPFEPSLCSFVPHSTQRLKEGKAERERGMLGSEKITWDIGIFLWRTIAAHHSYQCIRIGYNVCNAPRNKFEHGWNHNFILFISTLDSCALSDMLFCSSNNWVEYSARLITCILGASSKAIISTFSTPFHPITFPSVQWWKANKNSKIYGTVKSLS